MKNEALWLRNQYFDDLPQACITNPVVCSILEDYLEEVKQLGGVDGVSLDITDAYPNSGSRGFKGVMSHCFCDHCLKGLREHGFKDSPTVFIGEQAIQRLVLKDAANGQGTMHIDPSQDLVDRRDTSSLLAFSEARQFIDSDDQNAERDASRLLVYLDARTRVTASAVRSILSNCKQSGLSSAVVLGSTKIDMSQMVSLSALDRNSAADEYWLPDASDKSAQEGDWQALQFLAPRATYYYNSFFEIVEQANERAIEYGHQLFLSTLQKTSKSLRRNSLCSGSVYVNSKLNQYLGVAGVPLGTDDHLAIVSKLAADITGTVLPADLLATFSIGNPDRLE